MDKHIGLIVGIYGLACICGGFWAGTHNWYAFGISVILIGYLFYKLILTPL